MNTEKAIREAIRDHFSAVSDIDQAIAEEALSGLDRILRKEPAQTMFGKPYGFYLYRQYAAAARTR